MKRFDENKNLKSEVKDLKSELLQAEKSYDEELGTTIVWSRRQKNDLEQYTSRKFNLKIYGYPEQGHEEDNATNVMKFGHIGR